jgi:hypothetical protein
MADYANANPPYEYYYEYYECPSDALTARPANFRFSFQTAAGVRLLSRGALRPSFADQCPSNHRGRRESRVLVAPIASYAK